MPTERKEILRFDQGINVFDRPVSLRDGEAQAIQNLEWLQNGGLTPRPAWKAAGGTVTGSPSPKNARGLYTRWYESGVRKLVIATKTAADAMSFHKSNISDPRTFTSWTALETSLAVAAAYVHLPAKFAVGRSKLLYTNPGFPSAQIRSYNGTAVSAIATSNIAGRALAYHLSRFWTGGSIANPTYLRFTEIGDETQWVTEENFIPVGDDDGEPIEEIVIWDQVLIIGKAHSLWYLAGVDDKSFALKTLHPNIGCAPGSSLVISDVGLFILGLDGQVFLWDGGDIRPITRKVTVSPVSATGYMTGAWVDGKLYVAATGAGGDVWCYEPGENVFAGRWRKEVVADAANLVQDLATYDERYLLATPSAGGGTRALSVRSESGPFAVGTYRDPGHDAGAGETYEATTREIWPLGPLGKGTLRSVYLHYRQWTAGSLPTLDVTPIVDGVELVAAKKTMGGKGTAGDYVERKDFHTEGVSMTGRNFAVKVAFAPTSAQNPTYSLEEPPVVDILETEMPL